MKINTLLNIVTLALFLLLSSWSMVANAASAPVGKIILAVGEVIATNPEGSKRKLKRRSKIYSGDTLSTKSGARCQIRFTDKSLVALTESSIFKVDEYNFNQTGTTKDTAIYSLLKGGMRSISGAIGKTKREDYKLNTPVATIGVRGTAFDIGLVEEKGIQNLYGTVDSGAIVVENEQGELEIQPGQNFQAQKNLPPKQILSLPKSFPSHEEGTGEPEAGDEGTAEDGGEGDTTDESLSSEETDELNEFADTETEGLKTEDPIVVEPPIIDLEQPVETIDPITDSGTLAPAGAAVGFAFVGLNQDGVANKSTIFGNKSPDEIYIDTVDGIGNVPVAGTVNFDECNPCSFLAATGTLASTGGDSTLGVNWGRWSGDYIVTENGVPDTTMGSFHYIYSPNVTPATTLQNLTGTSYYGLDGGSSGSTAPTDQNGATGSLSYLYMNVDFTNQNVTDLSMSVTTPSTGTITVSPISVITIPLSDLTGSGISLDATNNLSVTTGYVGEIQGTFVGSNAEGLMTTYGFREDTVNSTKAVAGTALLCDNCIPK